MMQEMYTLGRPLISFTFFLIVLSLNLKMMKKVVKAKTYEFKEGKDKIAYF